MVREGADRQRGASRRRLYRRAVTREGAGAAGILTGCRAGRTEVADPLHQGGGIVGGKRPEDPRRAPGAGSAPVPEDSGPGGYDGPAERWVKSRAGERGVPCLAGSVLPGPAEACRRRE